MFAIGQRVRMTIGLDARIFRGTVVKAYTDEVTNEDYFAIQWDKDNGLTEWYQVGDRASRNIEAV